MKRFSLALRVGAWLLAPLDDALHGLSLTRLLAMACFVYVGHEVFVHEKAITWVDYAVMMLGIAAAFGKTVVLALIQRSQLHIAGKEIRETVDVTLRQIQERRAAGKKWEAEAS